GHPRHRRPRRVRADRDDLRRRAGRRQGQDVRGSPRRLRAGGRRPGRAGGRDAGRQRARRPGGAAGQGTTGGAQRGRDDRGGGALRQRRRARLEGGGRRRGRRAGRRRSDGRAGDAAPDRAAPDTAIMILDDILARTRADLEVRKQTRPQPEMVAAAVGRGEDRRSLGAVLRQPGSVACIAEFKRRSPSAGWINEKADLESTVRAYREGGASAVSVLTDEPFFGGRLGDLAPARVASGLTVLRKDFIIDPYQICEAAAAGAD